MKKMTSIPVRAAHSVTDVRQNGSVQVAPGSEIA
jgi:hypothetical protein